MHDWTPDISLSDKPRYLAIADAIGVDVAAARLHVGDRLPPQRRNRIDDFAYFPFDEAFGVDLPFQKFRGEIGSRRRQSEIECHSL